MSAFCAMQHRRIKRSRARRASAGPLEVLEKLGSQTGTRDIALSRVDACRRDRSRVKITRYGGRWAGPQLSKNTAGML